MPDRASQVYADVLSWNVLDLMVLTSHDEVLRVTDHKQASRQIIAALQKFSRVRTCAENFLYSNIHAGAVLSPGQLATRNTELKVQNMTYEVRAMIEFLIRVSARADFLDPAPDIRVKE